MTDLSEDQRLALANMHALAQATLRARDAAQHRAYLDALADYAPDALALPADDPRTEAVLAPGLSAPAARRLAATLRGVVLGSAAHADTARLEVIALARAAAGDAVAPGPALDGRVTAAFEATRRDLEQDVVRLGSVAPAADGAALRRWGSVRTLELNAFVAAFTRDGTHPGAVRATSDGRDAGALRLALAVAQAALTLARELEPEPALCADAARVETALSALLANVIFAAR